MQGKLIILAVVAVTWATHANGDSLLRQAPWQGAEDHGYAEPADAAALEVLPEEYLANVSYESECGCCDSCCECVAEGHDSCVDWVLPRCKHNPFPLLKGLAGDRADKLPLGLGTSFIWTEIDRTVAVSDVRLGLGATPPVSVDRIDVPTTEFHASSTVARIDLWVIPCLNIYGIVGNTRTTGDVAVTIDRFPLPASPPVALDLPVTLEGPTAGFGVTTGFGGKNWFAMLDINKTWTSFSNLDSSLTALVITPRIGVPIDRPLFKGEVHVGAMWQDTAQTVELTVNHPTLGNGLHVQVDQFEPNPWNFLVGGLWALDERLQLMVEGGMGGRSYVVSGITIRY